MATLYLFLVGGTCILILYSLAVNNTVGHT